MVGQSVDDLVFDRTPTPILEKSLAPHTCSVDVFTARCITVVTAPAARTPLEAPLCLPCSPHTIFVSQKTMFSGLGVLSLGSSCLSSLFLPCYLTTS